MRLISTLILLIIISCQATKSTSTREIEFINAKNLSNEKSNNKVLVSLRVDTSQTQSEQGLKFTLKLTNTQFDSVVIKNILDFLTVGLIDSLGSNIIVPQAPRFLVNIKGPYTYESFRVEAIMINTQRKPLKILDSSSLTIPPNGNLQVTMRIAKVLISNARKPYTKDQIIQLPKGNYLLSIILSIAQKKQTETFRFEPVLINYK
jgi:hypothetical protein